MTNLLFTVFGVVVAFLGLSLLVLIHELGHFIAAKRAGVGVKEFSLGFGKKLWGFKKGETEYKVCAIPLGGYVNMMGLESDKSDDPDKNYNNKSKLTRLQILAAGVIFNFVFAILILTLVNMHGVKQYKLNLNTIPDTPAASVLKNGDEIKSVNGVEVKNWQEVTAEIQKCKGTHVHLTVIRNGEEKSVSITPVKVEGEDEFGAKVEKWVIGIAPTGEVVLAPGMPLPEAFLESAKTCGNSYVLTYVFIGKIFMKKAKAEKGLGGPVLIVSLMTGAAKDGFFSFLTLLAVISLCLGIMNSLPIPILDGGHIMFLGLEAVRGKPLKKETMTIIQGLFFWLLILLMLFTVYLDIGRLLGR